MLHASVLEPNLDLSLGELKSVGKVNSTWSCEISIDVELFFQLDQLNACVSSSRSFLGLELIFEVCRGNFQSVPEF